MNLEQLLLQVLLLVVLASPLVAAILTVWGGQRVAVLFSLAHVGVTGLLTVLASGILIDRNSFANSFGKATIANPTFLPIGVPGDPGLSGSTDAQSHGTNWNLLSFADSTSRIASPDVQFFVGIDGLNIWLILLTSLMTLVAVLISYDRITDRPASYFAWMLVLETAVIGAFSAFDVILFYVFFELTLIPTFFLIGQWGQGRAKRDAAKLFFLYTLLGSLFTLVGLIGVVLLNPTPIHPNFEKATQQYSPTPLPNGEIEYPKAGPITFSIPKLMQNINTWAICRQLKAMVGEHKVEQAQAKLNEAKTKLATQPENAELKLSVARNFTNLQLLTDEAAKAKAERAKYQNWELWLFLSLMAGFAVKVPILPFHTWLPTVYNEAPIAVTMLLSAVLAKLGTYGILRIVLTLVPEACAEYGLYVFGTLGGVGIVYGALCAFAQKDMKLLTAYSSVSHLGLLVIAVFCFNTEGLAGAALHMVNHGLATGAMFALLGFLYARYRTLEMSQYSGLMGRFPAFAFLFIIISLANVGLPFLNNFVSEMLILGGLFDPSVVKQHSYVYGVVAASGIFLSAWYTMTMIRRVFFGPKMLPNPVDEKPLGMKMPEALGYIIPTVLCIALGVFPQYVINTMASDVSTLVRHGNGARGRLNLPEVGEQFVPPEPSVELDPRGPLPLPIEQLQKMPRGPVAPPKN
jgi:NADH-quinone oxidoreductase subunit M